MKARNHSSYWSGTVGQPLPELAYKGASAWGTQLAAVLAKTLEPTAAWQLVESPVAGSRTCWPIPELLLPDGCSPAPLQKIVLLGPESSGKSILARQLAAEFDCGYIGEYVRRWIDWGMGEGAWPEMAPIAQMQWATEQTLEELQPGRVILDTALPLVAQWSQTLYGRLPSGLGEQLEMWQADLVLLLAPDLPWTTDPQRCQPDLALRQAFFQDLQRYLEQRRLNYRVIAGDKRLQQALQAIAVLG